MTMNCPGCLRHERPETRCAGCGWSVMDIRREGAREPGYRNGYEIGDVIEQKAQSFLYRAKKNGEFFVLEEYFPQGLATRATDGCGIDIDESKLKAYNEGLRVFRKVTEEHLGQQVGESRVVLGELDGGERSVLRILGPRPVVPTKAGATLEPPPPPAIEPQLLPATNVGPAQGLPSEYRAPEVEATPLHWKAWAIVIVLTLGLLASWKFWPKPMAEGSEWETRLTPPAGVIPKGLALEGKAMNRLDAKGTGRYQTSVEGPENEIVARIVKPDGTLVVDNRVTMDWSGDRRKLTVESRFTFPEGGLLPGTYRLEWKQGSRILDKKDFEFRKPTTARPKGEDNAGETRSVEHYFFQAQQHMAQNNFTSARASYEQILRADPANKRAVSELQIVDLYDEATDARKLGLYGQAVKKWDEVLKLNPNDTYAKNQRDECTKQLGDR